MTRRDVARTAAALGGVVDLRELEGGQVLLPFDPRTHLVLAGPHQGRRLAWAREDEVSRLLDRFQRVTCCRILLRPWWRWWRKTPALCLTGLDVREDRI